MCVSFCHTFIPSDRFGFSCAVHEVSPAVCRLPDPMWMQHKRDNQNPKMSPQAVEYSHRCCYSVLIEIMTQHASLKETDVFGFKSHHIINVICPLTAENRLGQMLSPLGRSWHEGASVLHRLVAATSECINLAFFKTYTRDITYTRITVLGPVTRLWMFKCQIFLVRVAPHSWCSVDNKITF